MTLNRLKRKKQERGGDSSDDDLREDDDEEKRAEATADVAVKANAPTSSSSSSSSAAPSPTKRLNKMRRQSAEESGGGGDDDNDEDVFAGDITTTAAEAAADDTEHTSLADTIVDSDDATLLQSLLQGCRVSDTFTPACVDICALLLRCCESGAARCVQLLFSIHYRAAVKVGGYSRPKHPHTAPPTHFQPRHSPRAFSCR
jgi:hypothetical protein